MLNLTVQLTVVCVSNTVVANTNSVYATAHTSSLCALTTNRHEISDTTVLVFQLRKRTTEKQLQN